MQRFDIQKEEPEAFKAVFPLEQYVQNTGLDKRYIHLIRIRSSQINGCAYCLDMHAKEAKKDGYSAQWITLIAAWREANLYDNKERAVLNWAESVTRVSETQIPDADFDQLKQFFSLAEIAKLLMVVSAINVWNRVALALRLQHPVENPTPAPVAT